MSVAAPPQGTRPQSRQCKPWCVPLIILAVFFALSLIGTLFSRAPVEGKMGALIGNVILFGIVGTIMYFLCKSCHSGWAWVILVLFIIIPVIILLILLFTVFAVAAVTF